MISCHCFTERFAILSGKVGLLPVVLLSLLFLLGPELLSAQARREAILVLAQPPVIEQFLAIYPERPLGRHHLRSPECTARMDRLRGPLESV